MSRAIHKSLALAVAAVAGFLGASASPSAAQQVAGRWVLSVELSAGSGEATFDLEQRGDSIFGTYSGVLGQQQVRGVVRGNQVRFGFSQEQVGRVQYEGTVEGNTMTGRSTYGALGDGTFRGVKREGAVNEERP